MKTKYASLNLCALAIWLSAGMICLRGAEPPASVRGYYRFPAIYGSTLVFTAEGDLWRVGTKGGVAQRLTSHLGEESHAAFSPDGKTLAFSAQYDGPMEVYTMPVEGGLPTRRTFEGGPAYAVGWTPTGQVLYSTRDFSTLPDWQLATADPLSGRISLLPLSQASDGVFDPASQNLFFTRQHFQGSSTKRYQGGTAQNLWRFTQGGDEAVPLANDFHGTSKNPMWWHDRVYFLTDRDGTMNIWSMNTSGADLRQHTTHHGWDVKCASLSQGRIAYQLGADLHVLDIAAKKDALVPIQLASDLDQERERWLKKPSEFLTSTRLSPDGDRIVLTARGQVFVAPVGQGRFVRATRHERVRYREARFLPDGKSLLALSDETGELEFDKLPANGVGEPETLTHDGAVFRLDATPSPDGKWLAYQDKNLELWLFNFDKKENQRIATSKTDDFSHLRWSPDSQWLAYAVPAENHYRQIWLHHLKDGTSTALTSDRVNSFAPAWSPDGKWLYFLSERHLESVVPSPWGLRAPEPNFTEAAKFYLVSLLKDGRSPFEPKDELHPGSKEKRTPAARAGRRDGEAKEQPKDTKDTSDNAEVAASKPAETNKPPLVVIDLEGLQSRVQSVPVSPGNYTELALNDKHLYWLERGGAPEGRSGRGASRGRLKALEISNDDPKPKLLAEEVRRFELTPDGKKLLLWKGEEFYVVDAGADVKLDKPVNLSAWSFTLDPRNEWRQMFVESWRLMRDYFYDKNMHGVDWPAMRDKYLPLVERVTDRAELNDLIADLVGELSALHIFVRGGDMREGTDQAKAAGLGIAWSRDDAQGGYRIDRIYQSDPDYPEHCSPLAKVGLNIKEGDVIRSLNGVSLLSVAHPAALLRNQAGRQVLLQLKPASADPPRDLIVVPISTEQETDLRYDDWEYSRRLKVEEWGKGEIGYVHLRAMETKDIAEWARSFYPVFNRQGLIVDVRHNRGGNIDSWILEKLLRKAWFFWQPRAGQPTWNMPFAFRGYVTVLCDEHTASDGEAFAEGFHRLGLGKVIGTRTWGGEIWLSFDNILVDRGIATAAEEGVFGPEGKWLIEGHGVDPDMVVDNLPHATFGGADAQLKAAVEHLQEEIRRQPIPAPVTPPYPNKAFK